MSCVIAVCLKFKLSPTSKEILYDKNYLKETLYISHETLYKLALFLTQFLLISDS